MLKGTTISLRTIRESDLETYIELEADIAGKGDFVPIRVRTESQIRSKFRETGYWTDDAGMMLMVSNEDDHILGQIVFFRPNVHFDTLEIGYMVYDKQSRNKGVATEALNLMVDFLFYSRNLPRLQLMAEPANIASRKVALKAGFTSEGILRHAVVSRGEPRDLEVFSVLRGERSTPTWK